MTWDEVEARISSAFAVVHPDYLSAFQRGIHSAFNAMRVDFPNPDVCQRATELDGALRYMADPANWDEETGLLKRPGGARQVGIVLYSANIKPWIFAAQFLSEARD